jgi:hypothetical protein
LGNDLKLSAPFRAWYKLQGSACGRPGGGSH